MKRHGRIKLALSKETLRRLEMRESEAAHGAFSFTCPQLSCNSLCDTECRSVCVSDCTSCL